MKHDKKEKGTIVRRTIADFKDGDFSGDGDGYHIVGGKIHLSPRRVARMADIAAAYDSLRESERALFEFVHASRTQLNRQTNDWWNDVMHDIGHSSTTGVKFKFKFDVTSGTVLVESINADTPVKEETAR